MYRTPIFGRPALAPGTVRRIERSFGIAFLEMDKDRLARLDVGGFVDELHLSRRGRGVLNEWLAEVLPLSS